MHILPAHTLLNLLECIALANGCRWRWELKLNRIEWSIQSLHHIRYPLQCCKSEHSQKERPVLMSMINAVQWIDVMFHFHICPVSHRMYQIKWIWMGAFCMQHCCLDKIYIVITKFCVVWPRELLLLSVWTVVCVCVMHLIESVDIGFWLRLFREHLCVGYSYACKFPTVYSDASIKYSKQSRKQNAKTKKRENPQRFLVTLL